MKHKVTLPDGRRMMEGWTEEKTTGRMFGCVNSADGVELIANQKAPLSRNVLPLDIGNLTKCFHLTQRRCLISSLYKNVFAFKRCPDFLKVSLLT